LVKSVHVSPLPIGRKKKFRSLFFKQFSCGFLMLFLYLIDLQQVKQKEGVFLRGAKCI